MNVQRRRLLRAPRFMPLVGAAVGAVGGGVYWLGAQLWPTSIAVVLSMLAMALISAGTGMGSAAATAASTPTPGSGVLRVVFALLVKYNALMALSAASLPFPLPANIALGLIMIAGHASSRALVVSVLASPNHPGSTPVSHGDLAIALALGFAPAALIGIPGLVALVAAIVARVVFIAYIRRNRPSPAIDELDATQQLTELCFYLGALATWAYI